MALPKLRNIKIFRKFGISFEKTESITVRRRGIVKFVWNQQRGEELDDNAAAAVTVHRIEPLERRSIDDSIVDRIENASVLIKEKE